MAQQRFLALDLGAESGRAVAGLLADGRLELRELHRFPNGPVRVVDHLHWDLLGLLRGVLQGLRAYAGAYGPEVDGLGTDTWGVDFGLLGRGGVLLGHPVHYRDARTEGVPQRLFRKVPRREVYRRTGIQIMPINTLYQLYAMVEARDPLLEVAERLLFMPDLINYLLTGTAVSEYTIASTSQLYDMAGHAWATDLMDKAGLPARILPEVVAPGSVVGTLLDGLCAEVGLKSPIVLAPAGHDTAAAVAAVPGAGEGWCYLSSGTWSLLGVELAAPIINEQSRAANFTNEGGVDGTIRFLKNIAGLWIVQELRRAWVREGADLDYARLVDLAERAAPLATLVDPNHAPFLAPGDMPGKIERFCTQAGEPVPGDRGAFVRAVLESLALEYRRAIEGLEVLTGRAIEAVHVVGGGAQNRLLNRFTADATGRIVYAGPVEATAAGNVLMQAVGVGAVGSLAEAREIVRNSFEVETFEPGESAPWDEVYARFAALSAQ